MATLAQRLETKLSAAHVAIGSVIMFITESGIATQARIDALRDDLIDSFAATVPDVELVEIFRAELTALMPPAGGPSLRVVPK